MLLQTDQLDAAEIYNIMTQTVIPRPIAWIVTEDNRIVNIAPFSYFCPLSSQPATVIVSIGKKEDGNPKDTLANIRKNQKCTICMVDQHNLEKMHFSSKSLNKCESEAEIFDIPTQKINEEYPCIVQNASVAYFCTLNQELNLGEGATVPVILNVNGIYVNENNITNTNNKHHIHFDPVARIGRSYSFLGQSITPPKIP